MKKLVQKKVVYDRERRILLVLSGVYVNLLPICYHV